MTWHAHLRIEIAAEFRSLSPSSFVAYLRTNRPVDVRVETPTDVTRRRASQLLACGKVREARRSQSHQRAWARRRKGVA